MRPFQVVRNVFQPCSSFFFLVYSSLISSTSADSVRCTTESDTYVGNAQSKFSMTPWIERGICVRSSGEDAVCYQTLLAVLNNLIELRKAEYSGAAGVLALLPTIGALLGAPTNEVWTLLTILPFGGALAMALSFGGAIMPTRVEDYENVVKKRNTTIGSISNAGLSYGKANQDSLTEKLDLLDKKVIEKIAHPQELRPEGKTLSTGLLAMTLLFIGSQAAMTVVEQGGVIPWWCVSRWWMHLWYLMVTLTAITENIVQLPFDKQYKLFVSRVPYEIDLSGGESIHDKPDDIGLALNQLHTMTAAKVSFLESNQFTKPRNKVLVMVSVVGSATTTATLASFWRLLSKSVSIAVFVTGTAMFASVTLISLPMAVLALTLVLSAGVFGRAIAGWMVRRVEEGKPMIHVIVNSPKDAHRSISRIMGLELKDGAHIQTEINGHVFIKGCRVATRSRWYVAVLGVLANTYDLRLVDNPNAAIQPPDNLPQ